MLLPGAPRHCHLTCVSVSSTSMEALGAHALSTAPQTPIVGGSSGGSSTRALPSSQVSATSPQSPCIGSVWFLSNRDAPTGLQALAAVGGSVPTFMHMGFRSHVPSAFRWKPFLHTQPLCPGFGTSLVPQGSQTRSRALSPSAFLSTRILLSGQASACTSQVCEEVPLTHCQWWVSGFSVSFISVDAPSTHCSLTAPQTGCLASSQVAPVPAAPSTLHTPLDSPNSPLPKAQAEFVLPPLAHDHRHSPSVPSQRHCLRPFSPTHFQRWCVDESSSSTTPPPGTQVSTVSPQTRLTGALSARSFDRPRAQAFSCAPQTPFLSSMSSGGSLKTPTVHPVAGVGASVRFAAQTGFGTQAPSWRWWPAAHSQLVRSLSGASFVPQETQTRSRALSRSTFLSTRILLSEQAPACNSQFCDEVPSTHRHLYAPVRGNRVSSRSVDVPSAHCSLPAPQAGGRAQVLLVRSHAPLSHA